MALIGVRDTDYALDRRESGIVQSRTCNLPRRHGAGHVDTGGFKPRREAPRQHRLCPDGPSRQDERRRARPRGARLTVPRRSLANFHFHSAWRPYFRLAGLEPGEGARTPRIHASPVPHPCPLRRRCSAVSWAAVCTDCSWTAQHDRQERVSEALERHARKEHHHVEVRRRPSAPA